MANQQRHEPSQFSDAMNRLNYQIGKHQGDDAKQRVDERRSGHHLQVPGQGHLHQRSKSPSCCQDAKSTASNV